MENLKRHDLIFHKGNTYTLGILFLDFSLKTIQLFTCPWFVALLKLVYCILKHLMKKMLK